MEEYTKIMKSEHVGFRFLECGFHIHAEYPHIRAMPNGIIQCDCCGMGVVEVKCLYTLIEKGNVGNLDTYPNMALSRIMNIIFKFLRKRLTYYLLNFLFYNAENLFFRL